MKKRILTIFMVVIVMASLLACGKKDNGSGSEGSMGTLVIGTGAFNGVFSPFFYQTAYDAQAMELIFVSVCELDENNELKDKAGHIETEVIENDSKQQTKYTIKLNEGMTFSDGEAVTIDDLIFAYYVYCDPNYDGMSTFATSLDIVGLEEYREGNAETISGITRVDELTCTVLVDGVNIIGDRLLGLVQLVPKHYYGEDYVKGDLAGVKDKSSAPLGSGPFIFESYKNNIVTVKANENYFLGAPHISFVKYQVIDEEQKISAIIKGDIDITDPAASLEVIDELEDEEIPYSLTGYPGYGYIAISAKRIPDIKVREGLMHLMTRSQAIRTYYGDLAEIIERPMTPTLAEYPDDAGEYWGYDPQKALQCFKEAGYEQINGKLMKDGKQLVVEVGIGKAESHPSTPILTQMANDLRAMGGELIISDMEFSLLTNRVQRDDIDMWIMSWGNVTDCDMTQLYGSEYVKAGGSNRTWIQDAELDALMVEITKTLDFAERKQLVAEALDRVMSWATMLPVYQRKDMIIYNPDTIDMSTIPENTSTYYSYVNEIEKLKLK
ncbi:MAG: ABC transporter substrate-binding protein [Lachnospiraceae bacterium]|nr:ABC transporter substrate-binding protein [Lachnospiraceae bacterium]